jgi:hypothetical protein
MKTFKEYLTESKKVYSFKVKVAGELPENFKENLKQILERCKVASLEKIGESPIQAFPMDFPTRKNCEVTVFEVICEYPITAPEIVEDVRSLGLNDDSFRVRGSSEPSEIDQLLKDDIVNPDGLLTDSQYKEAPNAKFKDYFGDDFNKGFLKDLEKSSKKSKKDQGMAEYKLPKAKTDKTGNHSAVGSK